MSPPGPQVKFKVIGMYPRPSTSASQTRLSTRGTLPQHGPLRTQLAGASWPFLLLSGTFLFPSTSLRPTRVQDPISSLT